jgi:hypothetical protein
MRILSVLIGWLVLHPAIHMGGASLQAPQAHNIEQQSYAIDASVNELVAGYLQWQQNHPGAVPAGTPLKLDMPAIDIYSPEGISLFYGADSGKNATLLGTLPQGLKNIRNEAKAAVPRPSLKEAIGMFSNFKEQEGSLLLDRRFTVFAVTYPHWDHCKEQNDAIMKLRGRLAESGIRIIEVRLHK